MCTYKDTYKDTYGTQINIKAGVYSGNVCTYKDTYKDRYKDTYGTQINIKEERGVTTFQVTCAHIRTHTRTHMGHK